ncbi:MAG: hypothetical protein R6U55_14690, partial [Desulfovermiculus sp.]
MQKIKVAIVGVDSNNIGVLINGVPVNDMESGKVYWSNWAGLSDVTASMQVQRGLGASKLALSSLEPSWQPSIWTGVFSR